MASVALALIVLPQVLLAVVGAPGSADASAASKILYVLVIFLGVVSQIALNRLAIGPSVTVREAIAQGLIRLASVLAVLIVAALLLGVISGVIAYALGAAGLITVEVGGRPSSALIAIMIVLIALTFAVLQLVFPIAAIETGNPFRLVGRSWQLARGNYLRLLGFVIVVFVGLGIVILAAQLGLGSVIVLLLGRATPGSMAALLMGIVAGVLQAAFTVVTATMLARIYTQLAGRDEFQASVPRSGI
jgi:hypothetical protein